MMPRGEVWFSSEAFLQRRGGVSRCFCEIARAMAESADLAWRPTIRGGLHGNLLLGQFAQDEPANGRVVRSREFRLPGSLRRLASRWTDRSTVRDARRRGGSPRLVVHDTGYHLASATELPVPVVVTVHDLINDEDPAYRQQRPELLRQKMAAIARAARIVVPSFATRDSLTRVHGTDAARIDVIHHGSRMPRPGERDPVGVPYVLHVGNRGRYKDFATLMRAFAILRRGGFDVIVVNVGGGSLRREEHALMLELGLPADSIRAVSADDEALATLYAHARALAVPSHIEGFGIPILEAMSLGCPVACMEAPGCTEVAGDAALLAPIGDAETLAANLARLIDSSKERTDLVERGLERAARFTWDESARKHVACYEQCLG